MIWVISMAAPAAQPVTVDLQTGGIHGAIWIVSARWGVPIHLETVPYDPAVDLRTVPTPEGRTLRRRTADAFEFTYEGGALAGVEAALTAWSTAGGPGDYLIRQDGDALVLVPTTRHENGRTVPYEALSDRVIDLTGVNGTLPLKQTLDAARHALEEETGLTIRDSLSGYPFGQEQWWNESPDVGPVILATIAHPRAPAREIFDQLLALGGDPTDRWLLGYTVTNDLGLLVYHVRPADEALGNLAPIPPRDPAEDHRSVP
ncbi:MAG: hypothetical protein H6738_17005 [Alphaproteobacteria bacterium]|nr:hypothetical protein [Alphaproteobacteria bacterium]MCB9698483.1 hypothetical protein [Alphaproteobacteria bacterium]